MCVPAPPQALDAADKDRALRALARVTTKPLISKTLEYALSPAVRTQDVSALLVGVAKQGGLGFNMTWEFIMDRADDVLRKYGGESARHWVTMCVCVVRSRTDINQASPSCQQVDALLAENTTAQGVCVCGASIRAALPWPDIKCCSVVTYNALEPHVNGQHSLLFHRISVGRHASSTNLLCIRVCMCVRVTVLLCVCSRGRDLFPWP